MLFADTILTDNCNYTFCDLYKAIDSKICQQARTLLNNIRYGLNNKVNYDGYEDLAVYREILEEATSNSDCLCDLNLNVVISQVRKITNSIC